MITLTITSSEHGSRLDRLLRKRLPLLGLSSIYGLIRKGAVRVDSRRIKQDHRLSEGEILTVDIDESELAAPSGPPNALAKMVNTDFFKRNFNILFEDNTIIVCNKPAGLVVHSGSGHSHHDNLIDLAAAYIMSRQGLGVRGQGLGSKSETISNIEPPVLMHRLDRDTSGVILLAKDKGIARILHDDMRSGKFTKQYLAVCHNRPPEFEGTINLGMRRNDRTRGGMKMSVDKDGMESSTDYKITGYQNNMSSLEIQLRTGKTHQIRVHMAHLKAPLLGDERYGDKRLDGNFFASSTLPRRLYLHAHKLSFPHPKTKKTMTFTAPMPKEFLKALEG